MKVPLRPQKRNITKRTHFLIEIIDVSQGDRQLYWIRT
jgi:hypothetical protein